MTQSRFTRRSFLRGLAGALVTLPALEALDGCHGAETGSARAGLVETPATRFIALMAPDGVVPDYWFPSGGETGFTLGRHVTKLAPIQDRLLFMRGVDNVVARTYEHKNGHIEGVTSFLTGRPPTPIDLAGNLWTSSGISVDQVIAQRMLAGGYLPKLSTIHLGDEGAGGYSSLAYAGAGQAMDVTPAAALFSLLFEDSMQTADAIAKARERRKSILDGTLDDYGRLVNRVSGEDQVRIQAHLDAVRSIELRLGNTAICSRPDLDLMPDDADERRKLFYDLLVAAMTCDATRVATVSLYHSGGGGPQLPFVGVLDDIHELSHQIVGEAIDGPSHVSFDTYHQWFAGKLLYLVQQMQAVDLPGGQTLFDATVILQGSEISFNHDHPDMPYMIVAGADTPFRTGRFVEVPSGTPHNHLLVSLAHAFDVPLDAFGDAAIPAGDLDAVLL
ncbi:MAG TPA: DUF1552 domain-containing protein [Kofleriaceae bacterium]|nr:DUF1552 domain-containing protein [Kofleriaceae bacterium]